MKKNMSGKVVLLFVCVSVLVVFSACTMFTTSWGTKLQRKQQDVLSNASASELLAFSQGANASNPETVRAVLNLLSTKNPEELRGLGLSDKEAVLNLTLDATLPMEKISEIASEVTNSASNSGKPDELVKKLLTETDTFDTTASVNLLSDPDTMKNADPGVLANASVAVILQVAAKNGVYDKIQQNIGGGSVDFKENTADEIVNKMLGSEGSQKDKDALKAAVNVAKLLSGAENAQDSAGNTVKRPGLAPDQINLLGVVPLNSILGAF